MQDRAESTTHVRNAGGWRGRRAAAALVLAAAMPVAAGAGTSECLVSFDSAVLDVCTRHIDAVYEELDHLADPAAVAGSDIRVVKFSGPVTAAQRAALNTLGAEILGYVPFHAFKVRMPAALDEAARDIPGVNWVGPYLPVWKIGVNLAGALADSRILDHAGHIDGLWVSLHPGVSASRARGVLEALPGAAFRFAGQAHDHEFLVVEFERALLPEVVAGIALTEMVNAVDFHWPNELLNSQGAWLHQGGASQPPAVPVFERGIYGCGQIAAMLDSGLHAAHCAFSDAGFGDPASDICAAGAGCPAAVPDFDHRKVGLHYKWSGRGGEPGDEHGHGTFVAGNLTGNNPPDLADCQNLTTPGGMTNLDGMAPGAQLIAQEAGPSLQYLNNLGGTLYHAATVAYANGARVHNNSWGSNCRQGPGGPCLPGCRVTYRPHSRGGDMAVWENPDLLIFAAAGNSGGGEGSAGCGPGADVGSPGNAKNVFSIGSNQRGVAGDNMSGFSSRGPASDRRTRPDVTAQGQNLVSASVSACATTTNSGTSFASPTAAGLGLLVREYLQRGFYPLGVENAAFAMPQPSAALIRAIMINGSQRMAGQGAGSAVPNQNQGWGRILLDNALYFEGDDHRLWLHDGIAGLQTGEQDVHFVDVEAGEPLAVTLVWHDFPAEENANPHIVNLLRLTVVTPTGEVWTQKLAPGGGLEQADPFQATTDTDHDDRNNVHRIVLEQPMAGAYEIRVSAIQVAGGRGGGPAQPQPYALAASGRLLGISDPAFLLQPEPLQAVLCRGEDAVFGIGVLGVLDFDDPVILSVAGVPAGAGSAFSVNPVVPADPAASSVLTVAGTGAVAAGDYVLELTGDADGPGFDAHSRSRELGLRVDHPLPAPALLTPADGVVDIVPRPSLGWDGNAEFNYRIQIAPSADFAAPVIDQVVAGTHFVPDQDLDLETQYFWRVQGANACGDSDWSETFGFVTRLQPAAAVSPEAFAFTLPVGADGQASLEISNPGIGNLVWSVVADAGQGPASRAHDPALDETVSLPDFELSPPVQGGDPVVFSFSAGQTGRGQVTGMTFSGTASGVSGSGTWASNTCMIVESPGGVKYRVGGAHGATPGCGPDMYDAPWRFQGTASTNDGAYQSDHVHAFEPAVRDSGEWRVTFVHDFNVSFAQDIAWSDVSLTLHKAPLPFCLGQPNTPDWLSVAPQAGVVAGGDAVPLTLAIDTAGLPVGSGEVGLCLTTNAEHAESVIVPVALTVLPQGTAGTIEGLVESAGACPDAVSQPLAEATVTITGQHDTYTVQTDGQGFYQQTLDESESPLQLQVTAPGHFPAEAGNVTVNGQETTVLDFELAMDAPCLELDPPELSLTLNSGDSGQSTLVIGNPGSGILEWSIHSGMRSRGAGAGPGDLMRDGVLLVFGADQVMAFDPDSGDLLDAALFGAQSLGLVRHFLLHPDGERLLASTGQNVIYAFDLDGNNLGVFAPPGGPDTGIMQNIRQMAIHPDRNTLLVAAASGGNPDTIVEFDLDGQHLGNFIANGAGGISSPASILFRDHDILVSATGGGIYSYQHDGAFSAVWNGGINNPRQIVAQDDGGILAAAFSAPAGVWELDASGTQLAVHDVVVALTGIYPLGNGNLLVGNTTGVHEIDRDGHLVATKAEGQFNLRWFSFIQTLDCSVADWLQPAPQSGSVEPGGPAGTLSVTVDAGGLAPGQYTGGFCVSSNDPARPLVQVPVALAVTEVAAKPELAFEPATLDLGNVEVGDAGPPRTALLRNSGEADATGLVFDPPGGDFTADFSDCGETLPAQAACTVEIGFAPQVAGLATASLAVSVGQGAAASLELVANGTEPGVPALAVLVREGDLIPGYGTVDNVHDISVNDHGEWLAEVSYTPEGGGGGRLILHTGQVLIAAGEPVDPPPSIVNPPAGTSTVLKALNNHGSTAFRLSLADGPAGDGMYHNLAPSVLNGQVSGAPQLSPGTPYSGFFRARLDDSERLLLVATVNDSELPASSHRVLMWLHPDGGGWSEQALAVRHDVLPGMSDGEFANEFGTNYYSFQIDNGGNALYTVGIGGAATAVNGAIYYNNTPLVRKGDSSPLPGSVYADIGNGTRADMNDQGDYLFRVNLSELPSGENTAIVRGHIFNGAPHVILVRQGDLAPATDVSVTGFGSGAGARINDAGEVLWFAVLSGDAAANQALFVDDQMLVRKGETMIGGSVITTVAGTAATSGGISRGFTGSRNGRYIVARVRFDDGTRAAVMLTREPAKPPQPELVFAPPALAFGDVALGQTSPPLVAVLHNTGAGAATGLEFELPAGGFAADTGDCGDTLPAGASCQIGVTFSPAATGPSAAALTVVSEQSAGAALELTGNGVALQDPVFGDRFEQE